MIDYRTGIFQKLSSHDERYLFLFFFAAVMLLFSVSGCATPAQFTAGESEISENLSLRRVLGNPSEYTGETVAWGGVILRSEEKDGLIDLYIEETPFDFRGRPKDRELSEGIFIARTSETAGLDFTVGRKVTVAGEIAGQELGTYEGTPYVYSVILTKEIHLWKADSPPIRWNWGRVPYYWPDEYSPDQERRPVP
jgi:starvation-inducible outer membrane lipoprotein